MKKMFNKLKGNAGERAAERYLKAKGYITLDRNYKTEIGEIDLIMTYMGYLIFVEVKARETSDFGLPAEAVNKAKQMKICKVASQYIKRMLEYDSPVRFDVVEIYIDGEVIIPELTNHIEDAFESYLKY